MDAAALSLPEQLFLLALDPDSGRLAGASQLYLAMAGAVVVELVEAGTCSLAHGRLVPMPVAPDAPTAPTPLPVSIMNAARAEIERRRPQSLQRCVGRLGAPRFRLGRRVSDAVSDRGVIAVERRRRFGVVPTTRYALADVAVREELIEALRAALADPLPPGPRVGAMLSLAHVGGLAKRIVTPPDLADVRRRLDEMVRASRTASAVAGAAARAEEAAIAAVIASTSSAIGASSAAHAGGHAGGHGGGH